MGKKASFKILNGEWNEQDISPNNPSWRDWTWQQRNSIKNVKRLEDYFDNVDRAPEFRSRKTDTFVYSHHEPLQHGSRFDQKGV